MTLFLILLSFSLAVLLAFFRASIIGWLISVMVIVPFFAIESRVSDTLLQSFYFAMLLIILIFLVDPLRRNIVTRPILNKFRRILPPISATEQEILNAGTVWWEGELFSGAPHWQKLLVLPKPSLSVTEQSFLDHEVEQLCAMIDDWKVTHIDHDLSPETWRFIKEKGFFGMIIPQQYGGLGFSAQAHSAVVTKIASRSGTAAVTVMVPNSLGPAELLLHYGTESQKNQYLHRLATGAEIPCFALTGPYAGSDAGAIPDVGIVSYGDFDGQNNILGVRLTWEKRYITLAPVATLLGLAFKLRDPQKLLGEEVERGITLALIPTNTPGVVIGRRHFPLNSAFQNGPTSGDNVFIPLSFLIGGAEKIGHGWRMLTECLASGRAISLPASATGSVKLAARSSGAYARVRKQFKLPVAKFEGVEEALARIAGNLYVLDAARTLTAQALDLGEKPSVVSAIVKYHCTERGRTAINDAMDIHGGKGICLGPENYLARHYQQTPIGITVEGSNILTRSLMIFGQGEIRAHPYVLKEISAAQNTDSKRGLVDFDAALFAHIRFALSNKARSFVYALSDAHWVIAPTDAPTRRYYQLLTRYAASFAWLTDVAMLTLGGQLKRREKLSARLGDVLSQLYLCSAVLKRFEDDGRPVADIPLLDWALQDGLFQIQTALDGVLQNFPNRLLAFSLRLAIFPLGKNRQPPTDECGHQLAVLLTKPGATRDRLTGGCYLPKDENEAVGALEAALSSTLSCEPLQAELTLAHQTGKIKALDELNQIVEARTLGLINAEQALQLQRDYALRRKVIMVDDFAASELKS